MASPNYDKMSREELQKESDNLAKQRTEIRLQQVEVNQRLDLLRELDRLNIPPERLKTLARMASIGAEGESSSEATQ